MSRAFQAKGIRLSVFALLLVYAVGGSIIGKIENWDVVTTTYWIVATATLMGPDVVHTDAKPFATLMIVLGSVTYTILLANIVTFLVKADK